MRSLAAMEDVEILPFERLELRFQARAWAFADSRRAEIDAHFAARQAANPTLFNGQVLMLREFQVDGPAFCGTWSAIDYASFMAWKAWGFPDPAVRDCFAEGALRGADGAFLLGEMAPHTANGGRVYFPSGTPDPSDVVGDTVDLERNIWREIGEETGLGAADLSAEPGWLSVFTGVTIAHIKMMRAHEDAETLRRRILEHLAREAMPELGAVHVVRGPQDLPHGTAPFVRAYLHHIWTLERALPASGQVR